MNEIPPPKTVNSFNCCSCLTRRWWCSTVIREVLHPPTITAVKVSQITVIKGLTSQASETISHYLIRHWVLHVIACVGVNSSQCKCVSCHVVQQHQSITFLSLSGFKSCGARVHERAESASFGCRSRWADVRTSELLGGSCWPQVNLDLINVERVKMELGMGRYENFRSRLSWPK